MATPNRLASTSTAGGMWSRGLRCSVCSCGLLHSADSATNDTTSTIPAAQLNSHTGIGRSARPTMPWAAATAGNRRAAPHGASRAGASSRRESFIARASLGLGFAGEPVRLPLGCATIERSGAGAHRQHPRRGVAPLRRARRGAVPRGPAHDARPGTGRGAGDVRGGPRRAHHAADPRALASKTAERARRPPRADLLATWPRGIHRGRAGRAPGTRRRDRRGDSWRSSRSSATSNATRPAASCG